MESLFHGRLSGGILGTVMTVLNEFKPELDEKLHRNALVIKPRGRGQVVTQQKAFEVEYKERPIGRLVPDLIVDDLVIVDLKVVAAFNDTQLAQMTGHLAPYQICDWRCGLVSDTPG